MSNTYINDVRLIILGIRKNNDKRTTTKEKEVNFAGMSIS